MSAQNFTAVWPNLDAKTFVFCNNLDDDLSEKAFSSDIYWLFPKRVTLSDLPLRLDSNVLSYEEDEENASLLLREHYKVKSGPLLTVAYGVYRNGRLSIFEESKWKRRWNLEGAEIVETFLTWYPINVPTEDEKDRTGLAEDAVRIVLNRVNASVVLTSPQDGKWGGTTGQIGEDGVPIFNGMAGENLLQLCTKTSKSNTGIFFQECYSRKLRIFALLA